MSLEKPISTTTQGGAEALLAQGNVYAAQGRVGEAITAFQKALSLEPSLVEACANLAQCYAHAGQTEPAIDFALQTVLATASDSATTYLATLLFQTQRQTDAQKIFERYGEGAGPDLLMCFAQLFIQLEQRENGIMAYDLCAERRPLTVMKNESKPALWAQSSPYSAENPSARYAALIRQYEILHLNAQARNTGSGQMFEGIVGFAIVAPYMRRFAAKLGAKTLLDYGGGRGAQYKLGRITIGQQTFASSLSYLGLDNAVCFDPGFDRRLPEGAFDLVTCIDALEHCAREDLPWIIRQMFEKAKLGVFANIASYPARKILPNGENAHCTIEEAPWWMELFTAVATDFPNVRYEVIVSKDLRQASRIAFGNA